MLDKHSCIDRYQTIWYATKQLINGLWYLYNSSGYVISTYPTEDIEFIND